MRFYSGFAGLFVFFVILAGGGLFYGAIPAVAQSQVWIQVESQPNIRLTKQRAQVYAQNFADTKAYRTTTGWYAIVIGPIAADLAENSLASLKFSEQIPQDAFISDGRAHISQLWPVAANTDAVVVTADPTPLPVTDVAVTDPVEPEPVVIADDDIKATKALERSWTREQKKEYQTYMVWTGDYKSAIDGAYGPGTRRAITSFQQREGYQSTGYLTQDQVDLLTGNYTAFLARLGMALVRDLDAGIEVQMPLALVQFGRFEPPFVHYDGKPGSTARVALISQEGDRATLTSLYDIMETFDDIPADGYRVKKRDWFVLSGKNDDVASYSYVRLINGLIKGFSLVWTPDMDADMKAAATTMYDSFTPIADYVLDETLGYGQSEDQPVDLTAGIDTALPDHLGSGFFVSADGVVLTHSSTVKSCSRISLGAKVDLKIVTQNPALELAVLRPVSAFTPSSYALFSDEAPEIDTTLAVAGYSYPDVMDAPALSFGVLSGTAGLHGDTNQIRLDADLEDGDAGGPVLDDRGAVVGLQRLQLQAGNPLPGYVNFATRSGPIMALLDRHQIAYGRSTAFDSVAPEDLTDMAGAFTVKISCWN